MKRFLLLAIPLLALLSCVSEGQGSDSPKVAFKATREQGEITKTTLDGGRVLWSADDAFKILTHRLSHTFTIDPADAGKSEAVFYGSDPGDPPYVALYPASFSSSLSHDAVSFSLPHAQIYRENSFADGASPMLAVSQSTTLPFKHLCGVLAIQLTGTATVSFVEIETAASEALWGDVSVDISNPDSPVLSMLDSGEEKRTLRLDCGEGVQLSDSPVTFMLVIPPGTLSQGFTLKVADRAGTMMEKSTVKDITVRRAAVNRMSPVEFIPTTAPYLSITEYGVYDLTPAEPAPVRVYTKTVDQLSLRSYDGYKVFRIQSLENANALKISIPDGISIGDKVSLTFSSVGQTNVSDGTSLATLQKIDGGRMWLEDKENNRGYIIAGEL